jgi:DNA-binding XRE family transcriptional regulator
MITHPHTVRDALRNGAVTKARLAELAGVHKNTLAQAHADDWSPNWATLEKLCTVIADITREQANAAPQ